MIGNIPESRTGCRCTNHMRHPKVQHKSQDAALHWIVEHGMKRGLPPMEVYPCPTSNRWHVRTKRERPE